jgi:fermentation-respiration switch protein FrsA (DUF1100 family)
MFLWLENRLVFHPVPARKGWRDPPNERVRDVELEAAGARLHGWWCPTADWDPARGAVLFFHGTGGNLSYRGQSVVRWQEELGASLFLIDYPGYGRSTGRPSEAGCYAAADAAYDWAVEKLRVPPDRVVVYGGSLGGAVAIDLVSRRPHQALVVVSAFSSVRDVVRERHPLVPSAFVQTRFDNLEKIARCRRPVFIAHGTADRVIPVTHGERLFAAANEPKEFLRMEGYEHHHTPGPAFYERLRAFLNPGNGS